VIGEARRTTLPNDDIDAMWPPQITASRARPRRSSSAGHRDCQSCRGARSTTAIQEWRAQPAESRRATCRFLRASPAACVSLRVCRLGLFWCGS
jgi:hypothetical protein